MINFAKVIENEARGAKDMTSFSTGSTERSRLRVHEGEEVHVSCHYGKLGDYNNSVLIGDASILAQDGEVIKINHMCVQNVVGIELLRSCKRGSILTLKATVQAYDEHNAGLNNAQILRIV